MWTAVISPAPDLVDIGLECLESAFDIGFDLVGLLFIAASFLRWKM
jgi:hypothetical protein